MVFFKIYTYSKRFSASPFFILFDGVKLSAIKNGQIGRNHQIMVIKSQLSGKNSAWIVKIRHYGMIR
jgi:hypothetical protein